MKHYKRKELINSKAHGLTMKELREFVNKNPQIEDNTKVLIERIEDKYFEGVDISGMNSLEGILPEGSKTNGWKTFLVKGEQYYNAEEFNKKMSQEIEDRKEGKKWQYEKMENPQDYIQELNDEYKEQFFPAWGISKDKDFVYIFNHY